MIIRRLTYFNNIITAVRLRVLKLEKLLSKKQGIIKLLTATLHFPLSGFFP